MIVELVKIEKEKITLYIERQQGKHNSATLTAEVYDQNLTKNQIATKAWEQLKPTVLLMFSRVWDARETLETKVFEDVPEYSPAALDKNNEVIGTPQIIWAERIDKTPINEDQSETAISPYDEEIKAVGFEFEDLPPEPTPIKPPITEEQKQADIENFALTVFKYQLAEEFINQLPTPEKEITC